jgi:hypothetical protein
MSVVPRPPTRTDAVGVPSSRKLLAAQNGWLSVRSRRYVPQMRLMVARCSVDYTGRLTTHLPEGVRLLMFKPDGTFMVWDDARGPSVKPLNKSQWPRPRPALWDLLTCCAAGLSIGAEPVDDHLSV